MAIGFKNIYGIGKNTIGFISSGSIGSAPVNTVAPVISGTVTIGQTLSCTEGTWTGTAPITYTYQWFRDAGAIGGATNSTYVLTANELNRTITCVVTGTNAFGTSSATSNGLFTAMPLNEILGANYYDHWDYTDSATLSLSGANINSCTSKGTNAAIMSSTGTERPQLLAAQINGFDVADLDGINDFASVAASTAMYNFLHNTVGGSVIIVSRVNDANPNAIMQILGNNTSFNTNVGTQIRYDDRASVPVNDALDAGVTNLSRNLAQNVLSTQQYNLILNIFLNSEILPVNKIESVINGGASIKNNSTVGAPSMANAFTDLTLGKRPSVNDMFFKGQIAEVLIADIVITPQQQTDLQNYYTFKYGTFPII